MRFVALALLTTLLASMLTGCFLINKKWEGGIVSVAKESAECVKNFAQTLIDGNIETAKKYLHQSCIPSPDEIVQYVNDVLEEKDIDFTDDVVFAFDGFNPEITAEHIKYDIMGHATVGDKVITLTLGVMKDESGLGIYNVVIE